MRQDKWYVNLYGSNEGRVYVGPLGATCGVAEVHTTAGREQALRDAEMIVDAVNSVDALREQNRVLADERDKLNIAIGQAIVTLRYYAKTAISVRAVDTLERIEAALTATSQPAKPAGKMHACDIPGCVSCGNPEDATSQEEQHG